VHVKVGDREVTIKATGEKAVLQAKQAVAEFKALLGGDAV
jgi:hypothetical protein